MSTWLYQMSEAEWPREKFLRRVSEGKQPAWQTRKVIGRGFPSVGDRVILFYAKSGAKLPGVCGIGQFLEVHRQEKRARFKVLRPTNKLRKHPWWDADVIEFSQDIRGKSWRATLFRIPSHSARSIETGIQKWTRRT
jgi:hypothetical protein